MPRGIAFVLIILVVLAGLVAAWMSTTRVIYFEPGLMSRSSGCDRYAGDEPVLTDFEVDLYSRELRGLGEPSLYLRSRSAVGDAEETVRFTLLRSFHEPVSVRIERLPGGSATLIATQRPNGLYGQAKDLTRTLTSEETAALTEALATTQVVGQPSNSCRSGTDGSRWIVEAAGPGGRYVYINRHSPEDGPVRDFGQFLIDLTGWDVEPLY